MLFDSLTHALSGQLGSVRSWEGGGGGLRLDCCLKRFTVDDPEHKLCLVWRGAGETAWEISYADWVCIESYQ